jgi:glycosyltransferase involved in cell wall biosynthesis
MSIQNPAILQPRASAALTSGPSLSIALMLESDGPGGAETMLIHLAEELRLRGHEVCPIGPENGEGWLGEQFRAHGFRPEVFRLRHPVDVRCIADLRTIFRKRNIDVVHSHEFTMAVLGAAAAKKSGLPHFITLHGGTYWGKRWRRRAAVRWAFRNSRGVVAVSEPYRQTIATLLGISESRIIVVPNGIPLKSGDGELVRTELQVTEGEVLMVAVGNLYPVKGHRFLIEAAAKLPRELAWKLAIAGRGEEEDRLRTLIADNDIGDRVYLLGLRSDISNLLAAADVFVMPSLSEGLPLALLEAMAAGTPIVASAVGGIPEVTGKGRGGITVPAGQAEPLSVALEHLLKNPTERARVSTEARRTFENSQFRADKMANAYECLFVSAGHRG